jgi:hypothetical protein
MAKIFDREDEPNEFMEMPCRCDCGKWFDLNDGYSSERQKSKVICGECGEKEEKEIEREEEIASWKEDYQNSKDDMEACLRMLKQLGAAPDESQPDPAPTDRELADEAAEILTVEPENSEKQVFYKDAIAMGRAMYIEGRRKSIARINMEWISVEKGMPHHLNEVLIWIENAEVAIQAYWDNEYNVWRGSGEVRDWMIDGFCRNATLNVNGKLLSKVTHWMPLPEPPNRTNQ